MVALPRGPGGARHKQLFSVRRRFCGCARATGTARGDACAFPLVTPWVFRRGQKQTARGSRWKQQLSEREETQPQDNNFFRHLLWSSVGRAISACQGLRCTQILPRPPANHSSQCSACLLPRQQPSLGNRGGPDCTQVFGGWEMSQSLHPLQTAALIAVKEGANLPGRERGKVHRAGFPWWSRSSGTWRRWPGWWGHTCPGASPLAYPSPSAKHSKAQEREGLLWLVKHPA